MNNDIKEKFRTKNGYCFLLSDRLIMGRTNTIDPSKVNSKDPIKSIIGIYLLLSIGLFYYANFEYQRHSNINAILYLCLGLYLSIGALYSLRYSAVSMIEYKNIKSIRIRRSIPGLLRNRFVVSFENAEGKLNKRLILMPGTLGKGEAETELAEAAFERVGFKVEL